MGSGASNRNNFDFLRFALASAVLLSHAFPLLRGSDATEPLLRFTGGQMTLGTLAVNGFFILSGCLIAASWTRSKDAADFLRKRVLRIYPGYVAAVAVCALFVAPFSIDGPWAPVNGGFLAVLAIRTALLCRLVEPTGFPTNPLPGDVNGSLWTIQHEFICYLLVPLVARAGWLSRRAMILAIAATAAGVAFLCSVRHWHPAWGAAAVLLGDPAHWPRFLSYFFAGVCLFLWRDELPHSNRMAAAAAAGLVVAARLPHALALACPPLAAYLLFWFAFHPRIRLWDFAPGGDLSYGMYLYGFPILQLLVLGFGPAMHPLALFALAWPASVAAGAFSWHAVEKHFVRLKARSPRLGAIGPAAAPSISAPTAQ